MSALGQKPTCAVHKLMSAMGQKRTSETDGGADRPEPTKQIESEWRSNLGIDFKHIPVRIAEEQRAMTPGLVCDRQLNCDLFF